MNLGRLGNPPHAARVPLRGAASLISSPGTLDSWATRGDGQIQPGPRHWLRAVDMGTVVPVQSPACAHSTYRPPALAGFLRPGTQRASSVRKPGANQWRSVQHEGAIYAPLQRHAAQEATKCPRVTHASKSSSPSPWHGSFLQCHISTHKNMKCGMICLA